MTDERRDAAGALWTNPSVRALAGSGDPMAVVLARTRKLLLAAVDEGLTGPPIDPFDLAKLLGLELRPRADVADARIGPDDGDAAKSEGPLSQFIASKERLVIEYNPNRPRGRLRYSLAHEIAHALFPDVGDAIRHRTNGGAVPGFEGADSWQLELLCNVAAAELLMPLQAVEGLLQIDPDIDFLMANRTRLDVSTEALFRRVVSATHRPLALVAAHRITDALSSPLRVEYVLSSTTWTPSVTRGYQLPHDGPLAEPTAVGQTARGVVSVAGEKLRAQAVGIPAYPGRSFPRVLGIVEPAEAPSTSPPGLKFVSSDITELPPTGPVLVAHVVNDAAHAWGQRGVAKALARHYPRAASAFRSWTVASPDNLRLGNVHLVDVGQERPVWIASMVAQRGYGPSLDTRLIYHALATALEQVSDAAKRADASVHIPRIGAGQAGGRWDLIEQEIDRSLVRAGLDVTVHTPPQAGRGVWG
jgi:O-acetyl-ADP-ribose deacetylase (regulator of RNase III)